MKTHNQHHDRDPELGRQLHMVSRHRRFTLPRIVHSFAHKFSVSDAFQERPVRRDVEERRHRIRGMDHELEHGRPQLDHVFAGAATPVQLGPVIPRVRYVHVVRFDFVVFVAGASHNNVYA